MSTRKTGHMMSGVRLLEMNQKMQEFFLVQTHAASSEMTR
jgi:hypothetical protein